MSSEFINQPGILPQMPVCSKSSLIEVNSDFSLPDYQPEIRRLLSTRVNVLPPSEYVGNDSAEFSGELIYHILYIGNDGALYSASLSDNYSFSLPIEYSSKSFSPDEVSVISSVSSESAVTRVLAPRKLNVRAKLRFDVEILSPSSLAPRINGSHDPQSIENLIAESPARIILSAQSLPTSLSDFIPLDSPTESARIVDFSSDIFLTECSPAQDKISCRGDVYMKILYCNDSESELPLVITRKIPFSISIDADGVDSSFEVCAEGFATDEKFDIEENGINCELLVSVRANAQKNDTFSFIKDAYSVSRASQCEYQSAVIPTAVKCANANITQSNSVSLDEAKISPDAKIIDVNARAHVDGLAADSGRAVLKGDCHYDVLYCLNDEYAVAELSFPFKCELDARGALSPSDSELVQKTGVSVISSKARSDGEKLLLDSEIAFSTVIGSSRSIEALAEMSLGEEIEKRKSEILICYPEKSDTLWSVSKRYAEKTEKIKLQNAIADADQTIKKKYLII